MLECPFLLPDYGLVAHRTDMLDGIRDWLYDGKLHLWGSWGNREPIIDEIINHCGILRRDTMTRKLQSGGEKVTGVWRKSGTHDHFAFALGLMRIAAIVGPSRSSGFAFAIVGEDMSDDNEEDLVTSKVWKNLKYKKKKNGDKGGNVWIR